MFPARRAFARKFAVYLVLSLASPAWGTTRAAERELDLVHTGYAARMDAVRELGGAVPGYVSPLSSNLRTLGVWGGILLQTRWQARTGRSELARWRYPNTTLTLVPLQYLREFLADPGMNCTQSAYAIANPTRDESHAPMTQLDLCDAWLGYFRLADETRRNPPDLLHRTTRHMELLKSLWAAHTSALKYALWQYRDEIAAQPVPSDESRFFDGWLRVVDSVASMHFWTQDVIDEPMLSGSLPQCAPLGSPDCRIEGLPWKARAFVKSMIRLSPTVR